ncbi:MAG: AAA family ATPase [Methylophaga sp.]|nr:AAA family ATPase [Methylophaga sp.]
MDKRVVFAVAGSGKTKLIIDALSLDKKALVITYTVDNTCNLESRIKDKFGCIPPSITLMTYFTFLYSFCYMPFYALSSKSTGICWDSASIKNTPPQTDKSSHFFTRGRLIYHNRIAKYLRQFNRLDDVNSRIEKYFDEIFIDEIQDFASYDFGLIEHVCSVNRDITLVGDFHQHTFDTSRDGNYKKNLHKEYSEYLKSFESMGLVVDTTTLLKSHRCAPEVCSFISERMAIDIESHREDSVDILLIEDPQEVLDLADNDDVVKLFFRNSSKYRCNAKNWGKSKGENQYQDICVVLNGTAGTAFMKEGAMQLAESTRNKLYVACTRARGNIYFVHENLLKTRKI